MFDGIVLAIDICITCLRLLCCRERPFKSNNIAVNDNHLNNRMRAEDNLDHLFWWFGSYRSLNLKITKLFLPITGCAYSANSAGSARLASSVNLRSVQHCCSSGIAMTSIWHNVRYVMTDRLTHQAILGLSLCSRHYQYKHLILWLIFFYIFVYKFQFKKRRRNLTVTVDSGLH